MKTKHRPYSLCKKPVKNGAMWHARIWNPATRRYDKSRSTGVLAEGKKGRMQEAHEAALSILAEINPAAVGGRKFLPYLEWFWNADSPYFRGFALDNDREPSARHIRQSAANVRLHIAPFAPFRDISVDRLKAPLLRDWMLYMVDQGKSRNLIKVCQQVISTALSYLVTREELEYNPMQRVKALRVDVKEKGILTQEEVKTLVNTGSGNADARLATLLGCLCGLRLGEVRGLHWEDIKDGAINVRRNWQDAEGLKAPKYDSFRTVPLPSAAAQLLGGTGRKESGFVLLGQDGRKPPSITTVRKRFIADLASIGISREEQKRRNITFHSMRHTFVTLCRMAEISVLETQVFAGHRRGTQTEHYSHGKQMTDLEASRSKIETIIGITA